MNTILYIGNKVEKPKTGGEICSFNNQKILQMIFQEKYSAYFFPKESKVQILINKLFLLYPGLQLKLFKDILKTISIQKPYYVFLETAQYGVLAKKIKRKFPSVKVIVFFHNIEILYAKSYFSLKNPKSWYFYLLTTKNEREAVRYSDYRFTINLNDAQLLKNEYKKESSACMPFSVENTVSDSDIQIFLLNNKKIFKRECLFVGSNFFGNTDGLDWFIKEVLPDVDVRLTIVGNGMSRAFKSSSKITVYDFVDDLSEFYKQTDFVVLPIISGGGMKTKTAEAMMWGKAIIGTSSAFFGYEIKDCKGIYICNLKEEYINAINKIYTENVFYFNKNIHDRFEQFHSINSTVKKMKKFFDEGNKKC